MVVRVKARIKRGDRMIETSAVANSGYETDEPEIHIPLTGEPINYVRKSVEPHFWIS
mgnify:CR=1 FL=1